MTRESFEQVALRLLHEAGRPMYGLELVEASNGLINESSLYVHLARMVGKGLVDSADENPPPARGLPRKLYRITALGQAARRAT